MRLLVEILFELSRKGQQVIIATHSFVFLKWFDLFKKAELEDRVRYHALYISDDEGVKVESKDEYRQIEHNAIDDAYSDLTEEEILKSMGRLGK